MTGRTRIKICGVTRETDALKAASLGADAIGLNFWKPGSRYIEPERAAQIARSLPPFVSRVAIFLDEEADVVQRVTSLVRPDYLQFHGDEPPEFCDQFGLPYIKALRASSASEIESGSLKYASADALLLDTPSDGTFGGAGVSFDWAVVPEISQTMILAGGLHPGNVAAAIRQVRPFAVDVASGVESSKGIKDGELMQAFITAVLASDLPR